MTNYSLVNKDYCLMDTVQTTSFKKARKLFASLYGGSYKILFTDDAGAHEKNVNL